MEVVAWKRVAGHLRSTGLHARHHAPDADDDLDTTSMAQPILLQTFRRILHLALRGSKTSEPSVGARWAYCDFAKECQEQVRPEGHREHVTYHFVCQRSYGLLRRQSA